MRWHDTLSTMIKAIAYRAKFKKLYVRFASGIVYSYADVPVGKFLRLLRENREKPMNKARSVGRVFNDFIKSFHPAVKEDLS